MVTKISRNRALIGCLVIATIGFIFGKIQYKTHIDLVIFIFIMLAIIIWEWEDKTQPQEVQER